MNRLSFTVTLIFLLATFAIVHNAPTRSKRNGKVFLHIKTQEFYCTADMLKLQVQLMVKDRKAVIPPTKHLNSSSSEHLQIITLALQHFNFTCSIFTNAMAIKYQLQRSIFNGRYFIEESDDLVRVNDAEDIRYLINVLEHLQKLTTILQDIAEILSTRQCTVFSPSEYRKLYCEIFDNDKCADGASVLKTLKNVNWTRVQDYPTEWQDPLPHHCMCTGSCFT